AYRLDVAVRHVHVVQNEQGLAGPCHGSARRAGGGASDRGAAGGHALRPIHAGAAGRHALRPVHAGAAGRHAPGPVHARAAVVRRGLRLVHASTAPLPRYASSTRWLLRTSSGGPSAMICPKSSTVSRWQMLMTIFIWCSISKIVTLKRSCTYLISSLSSSTSAGFMPAAGSSSSRSFGSVASA